MLTDQQIISKYGQPGDPDNLTTIILPYPMRIAWDKSKTITKMQCHKLAAPDFSAVFNDLLMKYGFNDLQKLGIDLYGGCVNVRMMRGTEKWKHPKWSRHSWGIALDLDPERNQLKWKKDRAQFAKPEYKPMIDIFSGNDFFSLGVEKNYDFMHFEKSE